MSQNHAGLYEAVAGLMEMKRDGSLENEENLANQQTSWRNCCEYDILKECTSHQDEQLRMDCLTLLVETRKSTLKFTEAELEIIMLFLRHNLGEKMEFLPLIRKAAKRFKDSLTAMQRKLTQENKAREREKEKNDDSEESQRLIAESLRVSEEISKEIETYESFFRSLRGLCVDSLYPDATYSRRKNSLQILHTLKQFVDALFPSVEWNSSQAEEIFNCMLLDTYEINKRMAFELLRSMRPHLLRLTDENKVYEMIKVASDLGNSIRPIDSVTAAYMFKLSLLSPVLQRTIANRFDIEKPCDELKQPIVLQLLLYIMKELEKSVIEAKKSLITAITKHSLYGYLFCVRSLFDHSDLSNISGQNLWEELINRLISACFQLGNSVSTIVNNSSPEGHLPMDLLPCNLDYLVLPYGEKVTPQMVLLASWRTVKEISLLFGYLFIRLQIRSEDNNQGLLGEEQVVKIGEYFVMLLSETKHRGAFEQAYHGFKEVCKRLWQIKNEKLRCLPMFWAHQILLAITGLTVTNAKLCATRRSAGVPLMIQAIVSTDTMLNNNSKIALIHGVMKILLGLGVLTHHEFAQGRVKNLIREQTIFSTYKTENDCINRKVDVTEIKVHALNILRALFKNSQLGEAVKDYIEEGLIVALRNYSAYTWGERNAATLLFSSLVIRIFGVQRTKDYVNLTTQNKMTAKIFFGTYPRILALVRDELKHFVPVTTAVANPLLHSVLLLLTRLYISRNAEETEVNGKFDELIDLISGCARSRIYCVRELAARALVSLLTEKTTATTLRKLFSVLVVGQGNNLPLNFLHGFALQILQIISLRTVLLEKDEVCRFVDGTKWILERLEVSSEKGECFPLAAVYIRVLCKFLDLYTDLVHSTSIENIISTVDNHFKDRSCLKESPGSCMYRIAAIEFVTKNSMILKRLDTNNGLITVTTSEPDESVRASAWAAMIKILRYLPVENKEALFKHVQDKLTFQYVSGTVFKYGTDVQDGMFDFTYEYLKHISENLTKFEKESVCLIGTAVSQVRALNKKKEVECESKSYVRLLAKAYIVAHMLEIAVLVDTLKPDVYSNFCDSFWISYIDNKEFLESVFAVMSELYSCTESRQNNNVGLYWWTALFQLLVNDNIEIRKAAGRVLCKVNPSVKSECSSQMVRSFLEMFLVTVGSRRPHIAVAVLFCWSIELIDGNNDYEMDETDVFNKCRNYDVYEPVKISELCMHTAKKLAGARSIDEPLPEDAMKWINARLKLFLKGRMTCKEVISRYRMHVPCVRKCPESIVDPMYKDKLLQYMAYEHYASFD